MIDVSDPQAVAKAARGAKANRARRDAVLLTLMQSQNGREFLYDLLADCGVYSNPFTANALNTAFACGEMNVGQRLLAQILRVAPELYTKMIGEHNERIARNNQRAGDTDADKPVAPDHGGSGDWHPG